MSTQAQRSPDQPFSLPPLSLQEQSRLTFQHHALREVLSGSFLAPCVPATILDVACGSGNWTADMGKLFPHAYIVGLDRCMPTYPQSSNFQFIRGHTPASLPFDPATFDYVHQRCLGTVIPTIYWQDVVNELVRVTRPGGWVELGEYGAYSNAGPATEQFWIFWQNALLKQGIDREITEHLRLLLENAGLTHVEQRTLPIPLYGGRGEMMSTNLLAVIRSFKESILALGIAQQTFDQIVDSLLKEWQGYKTSYQFHVAYGQRRGSSTMLIDAAEVSSARDAQTGREQSRHRPGIVGLGQQRKAVLSSAR